LFEQFNAFSSEKPHRPTKEQPETNKRTLTGNGIVESFPLKGKLGLRSFGTCEGRFENKTVHPKLSDHGGLFPLFSVQVTSQRS